MTLTAVSACLAGEHCRYDGRANSDPRAGEMYEGGALCICPECLGGLPTPRDPSEIVGGDGADVLDGKARVLTKTGKDVTEAFLRGAEKTLCLCRERGVTQAFLKARSPSCGCGVIYDGTFSGSCIPGDGVTAALLKRSGIRVFTELD
ncbi:MAG: DUF523 domain-containing protein [Clostridiales bacterium]|nr:DUF523 domain-containing protein [Clostridiales bacterium]